jgi:hypothetical protein
MDMGSDKCAIWISTGDVTIIFDIKISTATGAASLCSKRAATELNNIFTQNITKIMTMEAHNKLKHGSDDATRDRVKALGWELFRGGV